MIFGKTSNELISAIKGLKQRKIIKTASNSESESDDNKADEGKELAETSPRKRRQNPDFPTKISKKQKPFHPAPSVDDHALIF